MTEIYLEPLKIRFCHDNISPKFRNGRWLADVFADLLYGKFGVEDMDPIHVVYRDDDGFDEGYYAVQGNRRLRIFKTLQRIGRIDKIMVLEKDLIERIFDKKYTTENGGKWVTCDDDPDLKSDMDDVIQEWKENGGDESSTDSDYSETESETDSDYEYNNRWSYR